MKNNGNFDRKFYDNPDQSNSIHGTIQPEQIRDGQNIHAIVTASNNKIEMKVWRISPLGVELVIIDKHKEFLQVGEKVDLSLILGKQVADFNGVVVQSCYTDGNIELMAIRLINIDQPKSIIEERRKNMRWLCNEQFLPTAVAINPCRFNDFIYFTLIDISSQGLQFRTSLRNKFLIRGIKLDCMMNFPMVGDMKVIVEITNVRISTHQGKDFLNVGAKIVKPTHQMLEVIGQYVLQFGPQVSLQSLKEEGLYFSSIASSIDVKTVRTKNDFYSVLALRKLAYSRCGKVSPDCKLEDLTDSFDARARILMVTIKGEVVASARLIFNDVENKSEQEQFIEWSEKFPRRDECIEITRACTHPDFRGGDLLIEMFRHIALYTVQSKKKYLVICATDEMMPLYKKIGFEATEVSYLHTRLNNTKHTIMFVDAAAAMCGVNVDPITWNVIWGDVSKFMNDYDMINENSFNRFRMSLYRMFKPISILMRKRYTKHKNNTPRPKPPAPELSFVGNEESKSLPDASAKKAS